MGYTTDFKGSFILNKPLSNKMKTFLEKFNETRRMARKVDAKYGVEGEFYVEGKGFMGQDRDKTVIDNNTPPKTQPSLWCQWRPNEDGTEIVWDEGEKFYCYTEWLVYLIVKILKPNGYVLNGEVFWQGEETGDVGKLIVQDNIVYTELWGGGKKEIKPEELEVYHTFSKQGYVKNFMQTNIVYLEKEKKSNKLIDKVLKQIVIDVNGGDLTAIEELLNEVDKEKLESFLSEN